MKILNIGELRLLSFMTKKSAHKEGIVSTHVIYKTKEKTITTLGVELLRHINQVGMYYLAAVQNLHAVQPDGCV